MIHGTSSGCVHSSHINEWIVAGVKNSTKIDLKRVKGVLYSVHMLAHEPWQRSTHLSMVGELVLSHKIIWCVNSTLKTTNQNKSMQRCHWNGNIHTHTHNFGRVWKLIRTCCFRPMFYTHLCRQLVRISQIHSRVNSDKSVNTYTCSEINISLGKA